MRFQNFMLNQGAIKKQNKEQTLIHAARPTLPEYVARHSYINANGNRQVNAAPAQGPVQLT